MTIEIQAVGNPATRWDIVIILENSTKPTFMGYALSALQAEMQVVALTGLVSILRPDLQILKKYK